jgi:hypothetical protein
MMGISKKAYARHRNVSPAAVRKAVESGRISTLQDGTIDPAAADRQWEANTDMSRSRGGTRTQGSGGTAKRKVSKEAVASVEATLAEEGMKPEGEMTLTDAKTAHEIVKTHIANIKLRTMRGELVDKAKATDLIFRFARMDRDAWQNWPSRISAQMAAELGVDAFVLERTLDEYIREHLTELSRAPRFSLEGARR